MAPEIPSAPVTAVPAPVRRDRRLFALGAWMITLVGAGHLLLAELGARVAGPSPAEAAALETMRGVFPMPGVPRSLADFYAGNGLGMGVALLSLGASSVLLGRALHARGIEVPRSVVIVDALAAWGMLAVSVRFFPLPPVVFLTVAAIALTIAAAAHRTNQEKTP